LSDDRVPSSDIHFIANIVILYYNDAYEKGAKHAQSDYR
jgi:hypothetical protein